MQAAIEEQEREAAALAAIEADQAGCGDGCEAAAAAAAGAAGGEEQGDFELVLDWSGSGGAQGLLGPTSEWLADLSLEPQPQSAGGDGEGEGAAAGAQPAKAGAAAAAEAAHVQA